MSNEVQLRGKADNFNEVVFLSQKGMFKLLCLSNCTDF